MRILMINVVCGIRSTGRICTDLAAALEAEGHEVRIAYGRETVPEQYRKYAVKIGSNFDAKLAALQTRLIDNHGFSNRAATRRFLAWAESYQPDLLWLHNIHGYYIHVGLLFDWIKRHPNLQVKWTLHDCWAFTGHCAYFTAAKCEQWKSGCRSCSQKKEYPACLLRSDVERNYLRKRKAFTGVQHMTLITPSKWLANLVGESFLLEYPVEVVPNTIDTSIFKPTPGDFRQRYGLEQKRIVLGVASTWDERKGLKDFLALSELLPPEYQIVLVGLGKKQLSALPKGILGLERTNSPRELAEIYTAADVFVNPTYQDNYPTVNLEARACGTPIITYQTGGSPESAGKQAVLVAHGDMKQLISAIVCVCNKKQL